MVQALQGGPRLTLTQAPAPWVTQAPAPYVPTAAAAQQFDISQLINMIFPIMGLMMVFGMLTPMMRNMSEGFGDR